MVDVLGVGRLRGGGEPDQVAEQRGDDLALLGDRAGGSAERRAALLAELRTVSVLVPQEGQVAMARAYGRGTGWRNETDGAKDHPLLVA